MVKTPIKIGERALVRMPHSEVCMHMRIAGKMMWVELQPNNRSVQLYGEDCRPFSSPILTGEAGLYYDNDGYYYYAE